MTNARPADGARGGDTASAPRAGPPPRPSSRTSGRVGAVAARGALGLAALLAVAYPFLHLRVNRLSDLLVVRFGFRAYDRNVGRGLVVLGLLAAVALVAGWRRRPRAGEVAALLLIAAFSVGGHATLLTANVELVHYFQFGLVAALLGLGRVPPRWAWIGAVLAGVWDEVYQHLVLYAGRADTYLDFNDMVLNAVGAAWAVVLLEPLLTRWWRRPAAPPSASGDRAARRWARAGGRAAFILLAAAMVLLTLVHVPGRTPFWRLAATGRSYHVLSAAEAIALIVLFGLLLDRLLWRRRRLDATSVGGPPTALLAALLVLGCGAAPGGAGGARGVTPPAAGGRVVAPPHRAALPGGRGELVITHWCGPPLPLFDDRRAAEVAAAGFDLVGAPCEGARSPELNRRALDVAARHGLKLILADYRVESRTVTRAPDWAQLVDAAVADYGGHAGLGGYLVDDEPNPPDFPDVAKVVGRLRAADPRSLAYVNLLPSYIMGPDGDTHRRYLESFVRVVRPQLLSYDHYPFLVRGDRPSFFADLRRVRAAAMRHGLPFWLILQAMPHGPYRDPSAAELRWQAMHALAHGASGVSYFAYWTPRAVAHFERWQFRQGLIEGGVPTAHYHEAARLNRLLRTLAHELVGCRSVGVIDGAEQPAPARGPIRALTGDPVVVGLFDCADRAPRALIVNRSHQAPARVVLELAGPPGRGEIFVPRDQRWLPLEPLTVTLKPGAGRLLRLPPRPGGDGAPASPAADPE